MQRLFLIRGGDARFLVNIHVTANCVVKDMSQEQEIKCTKLRTMENKEQKFSQYLKNHNCTYCFGNNQFDYLIQ